MKVKILERFLEELEQASLLVDRLYFGETVYVEEITECIAQLEIGLEKFKVHYKLHEKVEKEKSVRSVKQ